ncbi:MAG: OsmC family protein [Bacteroidales bacterium]|jgi:putative redox protein
MEITFSSGKIVMAHTRGHVVITDQPVEGGGEDTALTPFELFLASIGTCAGIYVKSFCDNRSISTENIRIIQKTEYNKETGLPSKIILDIRLPHDFPEKYKASLINVAGLCKVKKSIADPPEFEILTSV